MASSFDIYRQTEKVESKIVVALERISEAFRVLLWEESKKNGLSPIQIQILIFLLYHSEEKCTVTYLSKEFNMTKATISDSVKLLLKKGLVKKTDSRLDTRSYSIGLTEHGKRMAEGTANFAIALEKPIHTLTHEQNETLFTGLLTVIDGLQKAGIISIQRMCFSCRYYNNKDGKHYCNLLQKPLAKVDIRLDCPEHE